MANFSMQEEMQNPLLFTAGLTYVLHNKPDSVCSMISHTGGSHVSGMIVTNHLKRLKLDARNWKPEAGDSNTNAFEFSGVWYPASGNPEYGLARR